MNSFQEIFQQQQHRGIMSIFCVCFLLFFLKKTYFGQCRRRPSICEFYCTFFLASQNASLDSALAHLLPKCTEMKRHPNSL